MKTFITLIIFGLLAWFGFYLLSNNDSSATTEERPINKPSRTSENKQSENHDFLFEEWCKENPKKCGKG